MFGLKERFFMAVVFKHKTLSSRTLFSHIHSGLRASMCKTVGSGVGLGLHKPWPLLKKLLDLGWGMHTWRITALGGGGDTDCPKWPGTDDS